MSLLIEPQLKVPFPDTPLIWECPKTGLRVPKTLDANLAYRENLLRKAEGDVGLQAELMTAISESSLFWFNAFVWTFKQWDVDPITGKQTPAAMNHIPLITWEIQDLFITALDEAIANSHDLGNKKSRDMGASWCCLGVLHHKWLVLQDAQMLEMSRTRDYVDQTGNMKALFQKHDYINAWLPDWMRPVSALIGGRHRTKMHMLNEWNGSCLDGESTTEHASSGDRRLVVLLDEFAKVEYGAKMRSATADVTPCRIVNSTPAGAQTEYSKWIGSGKIKVFVLPWWEHPEKGKGRYVVKDPITGQFQIRSPWYDYEDDRRSRQVMAQEVDMDDIQAGDAFFAPQIVEKHRTLFARKPTKVIAIALNETIPDVKVKQCVRRRLWKQDVTLRPGKERPLKIFAPLIEGRLDQRHTYSFGIDVSKGQGASNSVIAVVCDQTREKVAEWASSSYPPYEFARIIVALALWCGGRSPRSLPFLVWEKNGPGWDVGRLLVRTYHYPYYYRGKQQGTVAEKMSKKYGWHNSIENGRLAMDAYRRLFERGEYIERSDACLTEMLDYITYPSEYIGPAGLVEESKATRAAHGDRVRATSLALLGTESAPGTRKRNKAYPANTPAARKAAALKKRQPAKAGMGSHIREYDLT